MINQDAIDLIKQFEGCKLTAYRCPANVWTIGYGHTDGVKRGAEITQAEADKLLYSDLSAIEDRLDNMIRIGLTDNQRGALISFAFNVGVTALKNSTLLQLLNNGFYSKAADEFLKWDKATVNGKKVALAGLTKRRSAERALFLKGLINIL